MKTGDISYTVLKEQILELFLSDTAITYNEVALDVFRYQAEHNPVYKQYLDLISCDFMNITHYKDIPLLPISLFKSQEIKTGSWQAETCFMSSGTKDMTNRSRHHVRSLTWYDKISTRIFESKYGHLQEKVILGLLPSYLENGDSSLVHMVSHFCKASQTTKPHTYLYQFEELHHRLIEESNKGSNVILFGVTFALLDMAEQFPSEEMKAHIIFTGGMKNKRQEMSTPELIHKLKTAFPHCHIHSEYGMTELLSQSYGENGIYEETATMKVVTKEYNDPLSNAALNRSGALGIIDLGNIDSCSFILTEDKGTKRDETRFTVDGRLSDAELRGCHLLYSPDTP